MMVGLSSEVAARDILRARVSSRRGISSLCLSRSANAVRRSWLRVKQKILLRFSSYRISLASVHAGICFSCARTLCDLAGIDDYLRERGSRFWVLKLTPMSFMPTAALPNDPAATDLGQWQIFENENPDTFSSMYQFWIQKLLNAIIHLFAVSPHS
jgi:hypothetical protein